MLCATGAAAQSVVKPDDYRLLVKPSSPALAPDGKRAALVVSRTVWDDNRTVDDLVVVDLQTKAQTTIVHEGKDLSDPAFSPDGSQLAYLANAGSSDDAHTQVFVTPFDGSEPRAVTASKTDVQEFSWRPDGKGLAYAATDPEPERTGADRFRDSFVFTTEPIVAHSAPKPVHLFVEDFAGETPVQLTFGTESIGDGSTLSWSPDGQTIALTLCRNAILNDQSYSHVALVDVTAKLCDPSPDARCGKAVRFSRPTDRTSPTPIPTATSRSTSRNSTSRRRPAAPVARYRRRSIGTSAARCGRATRRVW